MATRYGGAIGRPGATRLVAVVVGRSGSGDRIVRNRIDCPDGATAGRSAPAVAAVLSAAAHSFLAERAVFTAAGPRRRATRWTVTGRLDALGVEGFQRLRVEARKRPMQTFQVTIEGRAYEVTVEEIRPATRRPAERSARGSTRTSPVLAGVRAGEKAICAPMPGKVLAVHVREGDSVAPGTVLLVLEAMKMENDLLASGEGTVKGVRVRSGDTVNTGDVMVVIE
jgi:glutaconyl-CoA/methylmalonyl-CoA decarboxylase subunit gamma